MSSVLTYLVLFLIPSARAADYTGDGIDDLVVGLPYEADIGGVAYPGAVEVIRGSRSGLTSNRDLFIDQNTAGVVGSNYINEYFGFAVGGGDVDGDGKDDLIVGGPSELVGTDHCGTVWRIELSTSATATTVSTSQAFSQATAGVTGTAEPYDWFGQAVVVADFDGDGYDDVVVGIVGEDVGSAADAGAIEYLRGSSTGLTTTGQKEFDQDVANVAGAAEDDDQFGTELAAGDFNGDDYADLAIGIPREDWSGIDEGSVHVMYGSSSGPNVVSPDDELWTAGEGTAAGTLGDYNLCGRALAVGDFDGDGYDDLAIGCPGDDSPGAAESGSVLLLYGSSSGLDDSAVWSQATSGIADTPESGDGWGSELTSGDYNGDGYADLAISAPLETYSTVRIVDNGMVQVLLGSSAGLTDVGDLLLTQDTPGVLGVGASSESWGSSLASGDYNDDGLDDLAVGSPFDDEGGDTEAGVVNVFYGSSTGPSTTGDMMFGQDSTGIDDSAEPLDWFGYSLR